MRETILWQGNDIDQRNESEYTPLMVALANDDVKTAELLIHKGADLNLSEPSMGWTPLFISIIRQLEDSSLFLISKGSNVNLKNVHDCTPLTIAATAGSLRTVEALLSKGADVLAQDDFGMDALFYACKEGRVLDPPSSSGWCQHQHQGQRREVLSL